MRELVASEQERRRIGEVALRTPLLSSPFLADLTGGQVRLKLECLQVTGSFKLRGAANKILGLDDEAAARGVVACSSGNHGLATAHVAAHRGVPATICVPEWVDPLKLRAMQDRGAEVVVRGETADDAEAISFELRDRRGLVYVHPFDDPAVIAGQGTVGQEILEDWPEVDAIVAPVSGGGLVSGIAAAARRRSEHVRIVGAYASRARVMAESVAAGEPVRMQEEETIATALAGGIGPENRHTLRLVTDLVDELVTVPESLIHEAMGFAWSRHRLVVEGGGAVGLGAVLGRPGAWEGRVAVVLSGGNIALPRFAEVVDAPAAEDERAPGGSRSLPPADDPSAGS